MAFPFFTYGGLFFWQDKKAFAGWRLQENIWSRRGRILDQYDIRRFSGKMSECRQKWDEFVREWHLQSPSKKLVVLLPGFCQSHGAFRFLEKRLMAAGFETAFFSSPSRYSLLEEKAAALNKLLEERTDADDFHVVAFGLGGLVLRQACAAAPKWLSRLRRVVMIGVPNNGLSWMTGGKKERFVRFLLGNCEDAVFPEKARKLPWPACETAAVVGGTGEGRGILPFLTEDNDGIVLTKDVLHPNIAKEYLVPDTLHFRLLKNEQTADICVRFLKKGYSNTQRTHKMADLWN